MIELDFTRFPILVVDDEQDNLDAFRFVFRKAFALTYAQGGEQALSLLETFDPAVIVTDQRMPGMSGIEVLRHAQEKRPDAVGVLLTAYTDLPVLLEAINSGSVYRYVQKPWDSKELTVILRQAIDRFHTHRENRRMREQLARYAGYLEDQQRDPIDFGELSAESPAMKRAVSQIEQQATHGKAVLIAGEPGTEKELFARAIHVGSARESLPFVVVTCPAFPGEALEREVFGWEKGAFEGAFSARPGRVELAHGGTLLLADLDDELSPSLATQLQNLFDTGRVRRVGAKGDTAVDVRILATTSEDAATFLRRPPLGPRFAGHHLVVPPLRARVDDVPGMSNRLLARSAARHARPAREFSPEAVAKLMAYKWPGNVAELSCAVERAALICDRAVVGPSFVAIEGSEPTASDGTERVTAVIDLPGQLDDLERRELYAALDRCGGNKAEVARVLGIQRTTLYYRLKRLGIDV